VAVHAELDAALQELVADFLVLKSQHPLLARHVGERHPLPDQVAGTLCLVDEGLEGHLEGPEKMRQGKLHEHRHDGAAQHDEQRGDVDEYQGTAADHDGGDDDAEGTDQSDEGREIQLP